jgi:tetratricopeptide (TPR) repeat protein
MLKLFRRLSGRKPQEHPASDNSTQSDVLEVERQALLGMLEHSNQLYFGYGDSLRAQGDHEAALTDYKAKLELVETYELRDPNDFDKQAPTQDIRRILLQRIANVLRDMGRVEEAAAFYTKAIEILIQLVRRTEDLHMWTEWARALESHAYILWLSGDLAAATKRFQEAVDAYESTIAKFPDDSEVKELSIMSRMYLGLGLGRHGIPHYEKAIALIETLDKQGKLDPRRREWLPAIKEKLNQIPH